MLVLVLYLVRKFRFWTSRFSNSDGHPFVIDTSVESLQPFMEAQSMLSSWSTDPCYCPSIRYSIRRAAQVT